MTKRELVEEILKGFGYEVSFWTVGGDEVLEIEGGPHRIGRVWWRVSDGSVVRCNGLDRLLDIRVDLAYPGSIDVIREYLGGRD